jgi:hypothetical protein
VGAGKAVLHSLSILPFSLSAADGEQLGARELHRPARARRARQGTSAPHRTFLIGRLLTPPVRPPGVRWCFPGSVGKRVCRGGDGDSLSRDAPR